MEANHNHPLQEYTIVKNTLEYLSYRDLLSASQVSKIWNEVGGIVRRQRLDGPGPIPRPLLLLYHLYSSSTNPNTDTKLAVDYFNHYRYSCERMPPECATWSKSATPKPSMVARANSPKLQKMTKELKLEKEILKQLESTFWEPQLALFCWTTTVSPFQLTEDDEIPPDATYPSFLLSIEKVVPVYGFNTPSGGVFTLPPEAVQSIPGESLEIENRKWPLVAGMVLPKLPGCNFRQVTSYYSKLNADGSTSKSLVNQIVCDPGEEVKGIVLSHVIPKNDSGLLSEFLNYFRENPNIAFAGGLMERVVSSKAGHPEALESGDVLANLLVITGGSNVKVGSVLLQDQGLTDENIRQLTKFKDAKLDAPDKMTFAFMFSCCGRGRRMHKSSHAESRLFRTLYPQTPLFGNFTGGEYFYGYIPGETNSSPPDNLTYSFSTAFLFVSYSRP